MSAVSRMVVVMKALPKTVRLGLRTLRHALCGRGFSADGYLAEALWDLAHPKPGSAMEVAEGLTSAARWIEAEMEEIGTKSRSDAEERTVGFEVPDSPGPVEEVGLPPDKDLPPDV